jgi:hypothetical protein
MAAGDPLPEPALEKLPSPEEEAAVAEAKETRQPPAEAPGSPAEDKPPALGTAAEVDKRPLPEPRGPPRGFAAYVEKGVEVEAKKGTKEMEAEDKVEKEKKRGKLEAMVVDVAEVKVEGQEKGVGPTRRPAGSSTEAPILAVPMVAVPCFIAPPGFPVRLPFL